MHGIGRGAFLKKNHPTEEASGRSPTGPSTEASQNALISFLQGRGRGTIIKPAVPTRDDVRQFPSAAPSSAGVTPTPTRGVTPAVASAAHERLPATAFGRGLIGRGFLPATLSGGPRPGGDATTVANIGAAGRPLPSLLPSKGLSQAVPSTDPTEGRRAVPGRGLFSPFAGRVQPSSANSLTPGSVLSGGHGLCARPAEIEAAPIGGMAMGQSPTGPTSSDGFTVPDITQPKPSDKPISSDKLEFKMAQMALDEPTPPVIMTGKSGEPFTAYTNYIRLVTDPQKGVFQYDVKFEPAVDSKRGRFHLMKQLMDLIGDTKSFDGTILYLPVQLKNKVTVTKGLLPPENIEITITISLTKTLRMGHPHAIHLYNVIFRRIMKILGLAEHGRHYFDPKGVSHIPEFKLEIWPGFVTSIMEFEGGVMLCCDASYRVLRHETILSMLDSIAASTREWKKPFTEMMIGQRVLTRYNNKTYRIDDVDFDSSPKKTFKMKNGCEITYTDYYQQQYDVKIVDLSQPLLKSKVKTKIRGKEEEHIVDLIPELCYITGITDEMRSDFKVMKCIAQTTQASPQQRVIALRKFIKNVKSNPEAKALLENWGLSLADESEPLEGRVIDPESIFFGQGAVCPGSHQVDWTRSASNNCVMDPVDFVDWVIVCTKRDESVVAAFLQMARQVARKLGINVAEPKIQSIKDDKTNNYLQALQALKNQRVAMIVIILPLARADKYAAVKKFCCHEFPVPSQVVLTKTIRNPDKLRSVTIKIVLQMNCKIGGTLWSVKIPLKRMMVVGLDVSHKANHASVGALVSSMNESCTRWYSKVYTSVSGMELQDGLESQFINSLKEYSRVNGALPETIIMYRDGVGDGQMVMVIDHEIPQLIESCRKQIPGYSPKVLVVIVQKRISARFYAKRDRDVQNPLPGSVMDHTITRRDQFDFYLVSQSTRLGTVSPTHYIVAYNSTSMDPDKIQRLTYKMTHLYYNWCGTVRVPAPCQYAHKLAYLVQESLGKEGNEALVDKLYYL